MLPVHALLLGPRPTSPTHSGLHSLHGIAWGGERGVARVEIVIAINEKSAGVIGISTREAGSKRHSARIAGATPGASGPST